MMKITHYSNSFISVRSQGEHFVCDPWMGKANTGGWQSFPEYPVDQLARHLSDARWIYLSHLHDDHFHPPTLKTLGLLDREFVIKRFQAPVIRERLKKMGVKRIHEIDPFTLNRFGPFEAAIFPQMTSNSSGLEDGVNYDLDTSIVFKADGSVFFNQVDNPLSTLDVTKVRDWINEQLGPVDIACLMSGAASEYPQLFLGIDQAGEKQRIVESSLGKLATWLQLLAPKYYFPAGGTYLIPGRLSAFGRNIAQPNFQEICEIIKQFDLHVQPLALEGGYSVDLSAGDPQLLNDPEVIPIETEMQAAIRMHSADCYDYEVVAAPPFVRIVELLDSARENWSKKVQGAELGIVQSIGFEVYSELAVRDGMPDRERWLGSYKLFESSDKKTGDLIIHIDQRALFGCLTRRFVWNGVLGALCLYERIPNRHFPTDFFSLNYLVLRDEQVKALV
jgi:UDP-MurNAc hydroxylase